MKNTFIVIIALALLSSCHTTKPILKSVAYKNMYSEKPLTILIMPPINKTTDAEAKGMFYNTLSVPMNEKGYYVIPPFMSLDILKTESAYDAENFIGGKLDKFKEIFGADMAFFTIIHQWKKSALLSNITFELEYIIKSTKTNQVMYSRRGTYIFNTGHQSGQGIAGVIAAMAVNALETAVSNYSLYAFRANYMTFGDMPVGKYNVEKYNKDKDENAGAAVFTYYIKQ